MWSSQAVAKLNPSIGFQDIALVDRARTVLAIALEVLRSKRRIERSVEAAARMEVSTGLNATVVTVSIAVGQARLCTGALVDLERSYMERPEVVDAAKAAELR